MGRPVFPYELADPDFCWLVTNFLDRNPQYTSIETSSLPVVFIGPGSTEEKEEVLMVPPTEEQAHKLEERS